MKPFKFTQINGAVYKINKVFQIDESISSEVSDSVDWSGG